MPETLLLDHSDYGNEIRLERRGLEIRLVFVTESKEQASRLYDNLLHQFMTGVLFLSLTGEYPSKES